MAIRPRISQLLSPRRRVEDQGEATAKRRVLAAFAQAPTPCVVTIGTFDGVHAGHQAVLDSAGAQARRHGLPLVAVTFHPRPERVFRDDALPDLCDSIEERAAMLRAQGVDYVCVLPFDADVAALDDVAFVRLIRRGLWARLLVVGEDFRLGRGRTGSPERIAGLGLPTRTVALVRDDDGQKVSSTSQRFARAVGGECR